VKIHCAAVLFDMDGTLVESTAVVERCWERWGTRHGIPLDQILKFSHGRPTLETMEHFRPGEDHRFDADEMLGSEVTDTDGIVAVAGANAAVLAVQQGAWAVVTSAPRSLAEVRLRAASLPVPDVLVGVEQIRRGKPDPEGFLRAAELLRVSPADCVAFEDTGPGVEAATRAGMHAIALLTTVPGEQLKCGCLIRDFREVRFTPTSTGFEVETVPLSPA
jgi:mannitol-1-/sugar-/sorbitol-6-phosphatase